VQRKQRSGAGGKRRSGPKCERQSRVTFTGRHYHAAFEEACDKLPYVTDKEDVRSDLEGLEWILWEAIRGVFFYAAVLIAWIVVFLPFYFMLRKGRYSHRS
jgi:hypothetical protein